VAINDSGNLAQAEFEQGGINGPITPAVSYNAQKVAMTTRIRTKDLIYLPSGSKFLIDFNGTDFDIVAQSYDADGLCKVTAYPYNQWVSTATFYESKGSFAIAIRHKDNSNITPSEINNVQLKIYLTSVDVTIQLGQTVYGADINWDTGVMTVKNVLVDMGDLTWNVSSGRFWSESINDFKKVTQSGGSWYANAISSCYKFALSSADDSSFTLYYEDARQIYRLFTHDESQNGKTATQYAEAMTGQKICYELATPTTIQLTPEQLQMLKGYNRVTIDNGSIELGYIAKLT
jgi:hypothetical protein